MHRYLHRAVAFVAALALLFVSGVGLAPPPPAQAQAAYRFAYNWKGAWSSSTRYQKDDLARYNGTVYKAKLASVNQQPDTALTYWDVFAGASSLGTTFRDAWSSLSTYATDDVVTYDGSTYLAIAGSTNQAPDVSPTYWTVIASKGDTGNTGATGAQGPSGSSPVATTTGSYTAGTIQATVNVGDATPFSVGAYIVLISGSNRISALLDSKTSTSVTFTPIAPRPPGEATDGTVFGIGATVAVAGAQGATGPTGAAGSNGVTSLAAGTAIDVSGATGAVTVSNTGVTSLIAGSGISVSGATGAVTVSATSGAANFGSVSVSASTSSTSFVQIGSTFNLVTTGGPVAIIVSGFAANSTGGTYSEARVQVDGTGYGEAATHSSSANYYGNCGVAHILSLAAGTHAIGMQGKAASGTATFTCVVYAYELK